MRSNHGYRYELENAVWEGSGFSSHKEAQEQFQELVDNWISERLPAPKKWWQFWRDDVELPNIERHTF